MKLLLSTVLFLAALLPVGAIPAKAAVKSDANSLLASEPDCPREDRDICLALNVHPRCVNGVFKNDIPASCSKCYCSGCSGRCA
ncbi:hypothetical protein VTK73DRAFT_6139 [Phialemonium thermophilum]|uniref:Uncharacterized protein n=1 Tax=Phialemonium thermophilum TaxID=223376 RepID=A0ABR3WKX4_9PEZI